MYKKVNILEFLYLKICYILGEDLQIKEVNLVNIFKFGKRQYLVYGLYILRYWGINSEENKRYIKESWEEYWQVFLNKVV